VQASPETSEKPVVPSPPTSIFALSSLLLGSAALAEDVPGELLERLHADHKALQAAELDYRRSLGAGRLAPAETVDYQDYLARLRERLGEDCRELSENLDGPLPADLPCPHRPAARPLALPIDPAEESTVGEKVSALDAELATGLGEFDEMLLQEQQRVKAARTTSRQGAASGGDGGSARGAGGGGASGSDGASGETGEAADSGEATESTETSPSSAPQTAASATGKGGAGAPPRPAAAGQPDDIPDASDDDVVARQLREAAEKEQDPALKQRLWEEYRRYKRGSR
jgi:hypothetical protein